MRCFTLLCACALTVGTLHADETDRARAALELEMQILTAAKKPKPIPVAHACLDDLAKAKALAERMKAPLVVWVGFKCDAVPDVRASLADCVHCHAEELNGDKTPRLVVPGNDGETYRIKRSDATVPHVLGIMGRTQRESPQPAQQGGRVQASPVMRLAAPAAGAECST